MNQGEVILNPQGYLLHLPGGRSHLTPYNTTNNFHPLPISDYPLSVSTLPLFSFNSLSPSSISTSVVDESNQNLSPSQKELIIWHWRLDHAHFKLIQSLMKPRTFLDDSNNERDEGPIITPKHTSTYRCSPPLCAACLCGKSQVRSIKTSGKRHTEYELRSGKLLPRELIFVNHYQSTLKGRLPNTFGKESTSNKYCGGIIFVDSTTGLTRIYHLVSLRAGDTLRHKNQFEQEASEFGVSIQGYNGNSGIFACEEWKNDFKLKRQSYNLCGVGAHHQNGVAERSIGTIIR